MINVERTQETLRIISEVIKHCPEVRLGQLIVNLATIARGAEPGAVWNVEDDELLEAAKSHIEDHERRQAGAA